MAGRRSRQSKKPISKKRKFIKDGVFYAELNDFLATELADAKYTGCEVRVTPNKTEVVICALETSEVVGQNYKRARELTALIQRRFKFKEGAVGVVADRQRDRSLSALAQAEAVKARLLDGISVRRACYAVLKYIKDKQANGCEVVVSGKLRGQRAKSMKFREGYMIHAGDAVNYYIDEAVKHVHLRQGVLGIKVKIMLPHQVKDRTVVPKQLPDVVTIPDPKDNPQYQAIQRLQAEQARMAEEAQAQQAIEQFQAEQLAQQQQAAEAAAQAQAQQAQAQVQAQAQAPADQGPPQYQQPFDQMAPQVPQGGQPQYEQYPPSQPFQQFQGAPQQPQYPPAQQYPPEYQQPPPQQPQYGARQPQYPPQYGQQPPPQQQQFDDQQRFQQY